LVCAVCAHRFEATSGAWANAVSEWYDQSGPGLLQCPRCGELSPGSRVAARSRLRVRESWVRVLELADLASGLRPSSRRVAVTPRRSSSG
jgi:hypothetical protein